MGDLLIQNLAASFNHDLGIAIIARRQSLITMASP